MPSYAAEYQHYFAALKTSFTEAFEMACKARALGFDPSLEPESLVTVDVAERVEKSVGPLGIAQRVRELAELMPRDEVAIKVAEEVVLTGHPHDPVKLADQAIRTATAIIDEGVTVAPLEGITEVRIKSNADRTRYLAVYFAGPIRSAGGTDMGLVVVVADYVRQLLGLDRYNATPDEAKRFVEELRVYEREVARFQYKVPDEQLHDVILHLPVEVTGVETDPIEVASYRNLPRVETNRVRGGALRVVNDGLIGRAQKLSVIVDKLGIAGWSWLKEIRAPSQELAEAREFMFMEDVVGGRPIFCFPGMAGGFRLRYGRARNTGLAALGIHPSTMYILKHFIAIGTQLRIEKPGKAGVVAVVDSIEPPTIRLRDGTVVRLSEIEDASKLADQVDKVLFLGDILISFGEFLENNRALLKTGITEEWWIELVRRAYDASSQQTLLSIPAHRMHELISEPFDKNPSASEAVAISKALGVPLHPRFTYLWESLSNEEFDALRKALENARVERDAGEIFRISLDFSDTTKSVLEKLCVPHKAAGSNIVLDSDDALALYACANPEFKGDTHGLDGNIFSKIERISGIRVLAKAPTYVGARMGRPEKAKRREMRPVVHGLFPLGAAGGLRRNVAEAASSQTLISVELVRKRCPNCKSLTHFHRCGRCSARTEIESACPRCGRITDAVCPACRIKPVAFQSVHINLAELLESASRLLGIEKIPDVVKGVWGLTSETRTPEPLEKAILRAKHDLSTFKDGTVRFDATNAPLTHFTPQEIGVSAERLARLGYEADDQGAGIGDGKQTCALRIQDIILPETCGEYFVRAAGFVDEMLEKFYRLPRFYNVRNRTDLIGHLAVGLSPHTSVGVIGRIIGFTSASVCFAHPLWHAAKRRDCDGDEDSLSLLLDLLINFSRKYLPLKIGGLMDAPLLLTLAVKPNEVARQAFNMESVDTYPLRFYDDAELGSDPRTVSEYLEVVAGRPNLAELLEPIRFTHPTSGIDRGNTESAYKKIPTMLDKVTQQLALAESIRAVIASDVAKRVLSTHFMRDLTGNLKAFATQRMRCTKCNSKFRRIPLKGECPRCGGKISLTVYKGTVEKYLDVARDLVKRYDLGKYNEQRLILLQQEIASLFTKSTADKSKQPALSDFV